MWLVVLQTCNRSDMDSARASLRTLQSHKHFEPVMLLCFGPTMRECPSVCLLLKHQLVTLYTPCFGSSSQCLSKERRLQAIRACIQFLKRRDRTKYDQIMFWGHGSSWVLGSWKQPADFLTFAELNTEVFRPLNPRLVVFDACGMGSLSTLFGIDSRVKYVVASPGLQAYCSFLDLRSFFNVQNKSLKQFAIHMANEWLRASHAMDKARCMLVYNVKRIQHIVAPLIRRHWNTMQFDKRAQTHREDVRNFDVWTATRHLPHVQREIRKAILNVPRDKPIPCWRARGLSVDSKVTQKWVHLYDQSRWAKYLGRGHKRFHTIPHKDTTPRASYEYGRWLPRNLYHLRKKQNTKTKH